METEATRCATHPAVETNLRCSKCDKPICPRCLVQTPVGARCRECANLRRLPIYEMAPGHYLRAAGVSVVVAVVVGVIWPFIPVYGIFSILIALAAGYVIGEVVSRSVNRKRGLALQVIAGGGAFICYLVRSIIVLPIYSFFSIYGLIALAAAIFMAVVRLR